MSDIKLTKKERRRLHEKAQQAIEPPRSRTVRILHQIYTDIDTLGSAYYYPGKSLDEIEQIKRAKRYWQEYRLERTALERLKKRRLIDIRKRAGRLVVELTAKGRAEAIRNEILDGTAKLPKGKYCVVAFDFPEDVRRARQMFRRFLKEAKFEKVQMSVWKTDRDVFILMREFIDRANIGRWVYLLEAEER